MYKGIRDAVRKSGSKTSVDGVNCLALYEVPTVSFALSALTASFALAALTALSALTALYALTLTALSALFVWFYEQALLLLIQL